MMTSTAQKLFSALDDRRAAQMVRDLLASAGVTVGGDAPWDIHVHDERLYARVLREGSIGAGDAYIEGWWDSPALDQMMDRVMRGRVDVAVRDSWTLLAHAVKARLFNLQALHAFEPGERHYDIGNDLYRAMLGERMMYTCAYWRDAETLDQAQDAKLDLVCRKIGLRKGMRILDLGCGWGGFAAFAAERYGAEVVGMTVSREQVAWAREHFAGMPIDIRLDDYRNATGTYDAVVSIGLMEHVGPKNYRSYMQLVARCLAPGGVAFIHTIGGNRARAQLDAWFHKHIFPNAVLPTLGQLGTAMEDILVPEDMQNIGEHYDRTLMVWWENFERAWPELRARYGEPFYRMWKFYILTSAAGFRARQFQLYQIVATPLGAPQPDCRAS
ncbi:MAG TPA: cyclopropane fatty acyl phospholipid synthase [Kofleriaceae bacterium]|nr:cyclopropane fatty acyl phospholipid synthase [Kofleriaceae bacterium]